VQSKCVKREAVGMEMAERAALVKQVEKRYQIPVTEMVRLPTRSLHATIHVCVADLKQRNETVPAASHMLQRLMAQTHRAGAAHLARHVGGVWYGGTARAAGSRPLDLVRLRPQAASVGHSFCAIPSLLPCCCLQKLTA
jgi:hypothetical protein